MVARLFCLIAPAVLMAACMSAPQAPAPAPAPVTPAAQAMAVPQATAASALSYGAVTSQVVKDKTTQADLIQLFGGPSIATTDNDGVETWVYQRSLTVTDVSSRNENWQAAAGLSVFFGHGGGNLQAGGGQGTQSSSFATSFRSLTVVVKFNSNKTVKDYSVRASEL